MTDLTWEISPDLPNRRERIQYLDNPRSFEEITRAVVEQVKCNGILCAHRVDCCDAEVRDRGYFRVEYCVSLGRRLFDEFWNSKCGYRAWYCRSPQLGVLKNRVLVDALVPFLLDFHVKQGIDRKEAENSLTGASAKAWLAEANAMICNQCAGEWKSNLETGKHLLNETWIGTEFDEDKYGRTAYEFTKIRVFGACVNKRGDEWISHKKVRRAHQIHRCGWT